MFNNETMLLHRMLYVNKMTILKEQKTVEKMIRLYCKLNHKQADLCLHCKDLAEYAKNRLENCTFGEQKPKCKNCTIHCYSKTKRDQIRKVMRFSGPRFILHEPLTFLSHLLK